MAELQELPPEILQCITELLDPYSLCSLSRTNKAFQERTRKYTCKYSEISAAGRKDLFCNLHNACCAGEPQLWRPYAIDEPCLLLSAAKDCLAEILKLPPQVML